MTYKKHIHIFVQAAACSILLILLNANQAHSLTLFDLYLDDFKTVIPKLFNDAHDEQNTPATKDLHNKPLPYTNIINKVAMENELSPLLLHAIIWHESRYNEHAVSSSGAAGLMQLMPGTAKELKVEDSFNPNQNISGGARYYRKLYDKFGSHYTSLVAYNSGPGTVSRGIFFKESDQYARNVLQTWRTLHNQSQNRRIRE